MKQQKVIPNYSQAIYQQIKSEHPNLRLYSAHDLQHVLSWYITNGNLTINMKKHLCNIYYHINSKHYYHLLPQFNIIPYDNWILSQISKSL